MSASELIESSGRERAVPHRDGRPRVVIAGGGIAALEATLALDEIAGAELGVALLSATPRFHYLPLSVAEAFGGGRAYQLDLADLFADRGVEVIVDRLEGVDAERRRLHVADGRELPYDALLVAVGATRHGALPGALTFAGRKAPAELRRLLRDAASGKLARLVYVVPAGVTWTLPAYELALMTAAHFEDGDGAVEVALVTPEPRPLDAFGDSASRAVAELLRSRRVAFHSATATGVEPNRLIVAGHPAIPADAVVALPELVAPEIAGLARDERGFVAVDRHCRVRGAERVYAAGDITSFPVKQGGIAAQQADAAAEAIAADLGLDVDARPFEPIQGGLLLAGPPPRYRRAEIGLADPPLVPASERDALRWPHAKVAGRRLAAFLALQGIPPGAPPGALALDLAALAARDDRP